MKKKVAVFVWLGVFCVVGFAPVSAISEEQEAAIVSRCSTIKEDLKTVQRNDSRARVYLGRYYETILNKFITPLNVRLVENNLSDNDLLVNQDNFVKTRGDFMEDFVDYQKELEGLISVDCTNEPVRFYDTLEKVRKKRKTVADEVRRLSALTAKQIRLVKILREKL